MEMHHLHLHFYILTFSLPTKKSCILFQEFFLISLLDKGAAGVLMLAAGSIPSRVSQCTP
jgi:hypothetical protein